MDYAVNVHIHDFELNMFLNDHNIITHPHDRNANSECSFVQSLTFWLILVVKR